MAIKVMVQQRHMPPQLEDLTEPIIDYTANPNMIFCLVERKPGVVPNVMIVSTDDTGSVCVQTDLNSYLDAAAMMIDEAEKLGWVRPDGFSTDREVKRRLLEQMLKELDDG